MRVAAVLLAALVLPAAVAAAARTDEASGLRGVVMREKPICREGEPCEQPAPGVVLRFSQYGRRVAWVRTGPAGGFRVRLRPGRYAVSAERRVMGSGLTPRFVRVRAGRFLRVDFHLDTGTQ